MLSAFEYRHLTGPLKVVLMAACGLVVAALVAGSGMTGVILVAGLGILLLTVVWLTADRRRGFWMLMGLSFFSVGLTRYVDLPLGLSIDGMLVFIFILYFLRNFRDIDWSPLRHPVFYAVAFWMVLNVFEIINPEARSLEAWFYAMRGVALYFFFTILVGFLLLRRDSDFGWFISLWFVFSMMGTLWGIKQLHIGLDAGEKAWLSVPGNLTTHVLFGKLRVFSFYSDAGQFGASQAHTALVAAIMAIGERRRLRKLFFIATALLCFYGMMISGTRGALAIPLVGFGTYLLLIRNFKVVALGAFVLATLFSLLKFTYVGQGNYEIRRMRTALNPDDPSLQVRLENQKRLHEYLKVHPFGGGVGSGGYWGQRFSPGTFLANLALDSWYVRIAAEYGYTGLVVYLLLVIFLMGYALSRIRSSEPAFRMPAMALFCGIAGILVASYANQVFGQLPTGMLVYLSLVFITQKKQDHASTSFA